MKRLVAAVVLYPIFAFFCLIVVSKWLALNVPYFSPGYGFYYPVDAPALYASFCGSIVLPIVIGVVRLKGIRIERFLQLTMISIPVFLLPYAIISFEALKIWDLNLMLTLAALCIMAIITSGYFWLIVFRPKKYSSRR